MGSVKRTKSHREREDSLVVVLSPRCSKSQNTTPEASLGHPPYERYAVAGNLESWSVATEKESFRQQSRKVRVSSEFSSVKWNADVTVLWGQGIIYPLYSFQSYCPAPQSANKDHLLLFCVYIECGKFLKVYPFLP